MKRTNGWVIVSCRYRRTLSCPFFFDLHLSGEKFLLLRYKNPLVTNSARCIYVLWLHFEHFSAYCCF